MSNYKLQFEVVFTTSLSGMCNTQFAKFEKINLDACKEKFEKNTVRRYSMKVLNHFIKKKNIHIGNIRPECMDCLFELENIFFPVNDELMNGSVAELVHLFKYADPTKNEMTIKIKYKEMNYYRLKFEVSFITYLKGRIRVRCYKSEFNANADAYKETFDYYSVRQYSMKVLKDFIKKDDIHIERDLVLEDIDCKFKLENIFFPMNVDKMNGSVSDLVHVFNVADPRKVEMIVRVGYVHFYTWC